MGITMRGLIDTRRETRWDMCESPACIGQRESPLVEMFLTKVENYSVHPGVLHVKL